MPIYVTANDLPLVIEYPDSDDLAKIAAIYVRRISSGHLASYATADQAIVVNYGRLTTVSVTREPRMAFRLPVFKSTVEEERRMTDARSVGTT